MGNPFLRRNAFYGFSEFNGFSAWPALPAGYNENAWHGDLFTTWLDSGPVSSPLSWYNSIVAGNIPSAWSAMGPTPDTKNAIIAPSGIRINGVAFPYGYKPTTWQYYLQQYLVNKGALKAPPVHQEPSTGTPLNTTPFPATTQTSNPITTPTGGNAGSGIPATTEATPPPPAAASQSSSKVGLIAAALAAAAYALSK